MVPTPTPHAHVLHRRALLARGGAALAALWLGREARLLFAGEEAPVARRAEATLDHLVLLWMAGGPSHLDTLDPKPGRPTGGPFAARETQVPGLTLCEHLPQVAARAGDLALVRSLTSKEGAHERAVRLLQTGYPPSATIDHPHVGAWLARALGEPASGLPAFVAVGSSVGSGFLGAGLAPFEIADAGRGLTDVVPPVPPARQERRTALHEALGTAPRDAGPVPGALAAARERARRLMASPAVAAFDVAREPEAVRRAYGDTPFGKACLLARRLVEADVKVVHVTLGGWDLHRDAFPATKRLLGQVDPALATLVADLRERGLLDRTLVAFVGEFGRTPTINATAGRDHFPLAFAAALAGGGVPGGTVLGATDEDGAKVVQDPVEPPRLLATVLALAGLDPHERVTTDTGRPIWPVPKEALPLDALLPADLRPPAAPPA